MTQQQLNEKITAFIEENRDAIVRDIAAVVAVPSVEGDPAPGAPFGAGPRKALDEALAIATRLGLATNDGEGYVGWAEVPGREKGYLATITHMDVVPEGEGWTGDPYTLREQDGWLIARGTEDDKGPSILCLYAAAFLQRHMGELRYPVRVLLGCNEETGMGDVDEYLARNEEPLFCFTPDSEFPVCNGEKGLFEAEYVSAPLDGNIVEIQGGYASNVIPSSATALVKADAAALKGSEWITVTEENGMARLDARGLSGHAAHPEGTVNAIGKLVEYLLQKDLCTEEENCFLALLYKLHSASDGTGLGVACRDDKFDPLTIIGGEIALQDGRIVQSMNSRYPTATTGEALQRALGALAAQHGAELNVKMISKPFYIPADSAPIQALLETYKEVTGDTQAQPFTMGGGTYARHFAHAVSYGPTVHGGPAAPEIVGSVHGPNEGVNLNVMLDALRIYILALCRLEELEY